MSYFAADSPSTYVKNQHLLTGTNPPRWLSVVEIAGMARQAEYQSTKLAGVLGLGKRTFERRFQRAFQCKPRTWLARQRMQDAQMYLERGWTPKQAAAEVALVHPQSLFRLFRRCLGCTPVEYQQRREMPARPTVSRESVAGVVSHPVTPLSHSVTAPALRLTVAI